MLEELDKHRPLLDELVDAVYRAYTKQSLGHKKKYLIALYDDLLEFEPIYPLERADIEQELSFRWVIFISQYYKAKPNFTLRQYLIRRSIWSMKDWFRHLMRQPPYWADAATVILPEFTGFVLNFKFLVHGTDLFPFDSLTPYERYLIFLKFKEERSILQISKAVQKTRKTVAAQLNNIYAKLRSQV